MHLHLIQELGPKLKAFEEKGKMVCPTKNNKLKIKPEISMLYFSIKFYSKLSITEDKMKQNCTLKMHKESVEIKPLQGTWL